MGETMTFTPDAMDDASIREAFADVTPEQIIGAGALDGVMERPFGADLMTAALPEDPIFAPRATGTLTKTEPFPDRTDDD